MAVIIGVILKLSTDKLRIVLGLYMTLARGITAVHHLSEIADAMHVSNRNFLTGVFSTLTKV
jgi:hypothetical protein